MKKKKLLAILLSICCIASLTACEDKNDDDNTSVFSSVKESKESEESIEVLAATTAVETTEETKETPEETVEETKEEPKQPAGTAMTTSYPTNIPLSDDLYSFQVSVNGVVYQFPMWYSDFESLGYVFQSDNTEMVKTNQYVSENWKRDGFSFYTYIGNFAINSSPVSECEVMGINFDPYYLKDCTYEIELPGGIKYGVSTKDDIIAAYGTPSSDYEGSLYYQMKYELDSYNYLELYVFHDTGVLQEITIKNFVKLEGGNDSISEEVPQQVKDYVAPTAIGKDLYSFDFEVEGHLYTLPCPISEFLNNGFTIDTANSAEFIASGNSDWVTLRYNNQSIKFLARNYADYATIPENCIIHDFETSSYSFKPTFDVVTPCGVTLGTTEPDLIAAIGDCYYETYEGSSYTNYTVYDNNRSKSNSYCFTVIDGIVNDIEIEHERLK